MMMIRPARLLAACPVALLATVTLAVPARAQIPTVSEPLRPHPALDLDGGLLRDRDGHLWAAFGRIGAGVFWFDGARLLATTVELGQPWSSRRTLGLAAQLAHIQSGLGATVTVVRDLGHGGVGAGLGASFSLVNVQAVLLTAGGTARTVSFFLRLPLGLLWHAWRRSTP